MHSHDNGLLKHVSRQQTRLEESKRYLELIHGFRDNAFVKHSSGTVRRGVFDAGRLAVIKGSGFVNSKSTQSGGGFEYLHRSPASRRGRRKGSLESEIIKYGQDSHGTRTQKWLLWRGPGAVVNDRPVLSSERVPHINKSASVWQ
jgi:predicted nucleic acid-binding Zn ribbon protein